MKGKIKSQNALYSRFFRQVILFFIVNLSILSSTSYGLVVMLDPGHGGADSGAIRSGVKEAEIAYSTCQQLASALSEIPGITTYITRSKNQNMSLEKRVDLFEREKADILISVHVNASPNTAASGVEMYIQNQLPPDEEAILIAHRENELSNENEDLKGELRPPKGELGNGELRPHKKNKSERRARSQSSSNNEVDHILWDLKHQTKMKRSFKFSQIIWQHWVDQNLYASEVHKKRNAIRQAPFYVLSNANKPAILLEIGYLSHVEEGRLLIQNDYQKKIAHCLAQSIKEYKDLIDKSL